MSPYQRTSRDDTAADTHQEDFRTKLPFEFGDLAPIKQERDTPLAFDTSKELLKAALHGSSISGKKRAAAPSSDSRPTQRTRLAGDIIAIRVSTNAPETVYIHYALLPRAAKILLESIRTESPYSSCKELALPEEEASTVRQWKDWLYMEAVCVRTKSISDMTCEDHAAEWTSLAKLYVLGANLEDHNCCNAVMEAMVEKIEEKDPQNRSWWPADHIVNILYNGTEQGSPARDFLVEAYLSYPNGPDNLISEDSGKNHVGFLTDLTRVLLKEREVEYPEDHFSSQKRRFFVTCEDDEDQEMT